MATFNPFRTFAADGKALRQWNDLPFSVWQTCHACHQNFELASGAPLRIDCLCDACRAQQDTQSACPRCAATTSIFQRCIECQQYREQHTDACRRSMQVVNASRAAYRALWPDFCQCCDGTGQEEVWEYPDAPNWLAECSRCVRLGLCPRCGASSFAQDGYDPCAACGFRSGDAGLPSSLFLCVCAPVPTLVPTVSDATPFLPPFSELFV